MAEAVAEKPASKPEVAVPTFGTIPVNEMVKPTVYKTLSKAELASRAAYDNFVKGIPAGRVGTVAIPAGQSARAIMGRIRGALKRCGLTHVRMASNQDKNQVEVQLK